MWSAYKKGYKAYLQLERSLSDHSVEAYLRDIDKLTAYLLCAGEKKSPAEVDLQTLQHLLKWTTGLGMTPASQARMISGIKGFYKYCLIENIVAQDPTALLDAPKLNRTLPDVLSFAEIETMLHAIDQSKPEGGRNKAILETMYSCGLRVSEVVNLQISCSVPGCWFYSRNRQRQQRKTSTHRHRSNQVY